MRRLLKNNLIENVVLFLVSGSIYYGIEFIWKNYISSGTSIIHWSMFILGGLCGLAIGQLNEIKLTWEMGLLRQGLYGTIIVTTMEFIFGCILNLWLKLGIWNYSAIPGNILGQICIPFCIAWFFLSLVAIFLDDFLRERLFMEERHHYHWLDYSICE